MIFQPACRIVLLAGAILLAALAAPPAARAQPAFDPIPPERLVGNTLVLKDLNCSIELPGEGWQWLGERKKVEATAYVCESPARDQVLSFTVTSGRFGDLDEQGIDRFLRGMTKGMAKSVGDVTVVERAPADLPVPGKSWRFVVRIEGGGDVTGYVTAARRLYQVSTIVPGQGEPPDLARFARSFKLLEAPNTAGFDDAAFDDAAFALGELIGELLCLGIAVAGVVYLIRYVSRKPPPPPPAP